MGLGVSEGGFASQALLDDYTRNEVIRGILACF